MKRIGYAIATDYSQKYFDECKYIWENYVPKSGQADNLQGELLREIEEITLIMSYIKECRILLKDNFLFVYYWG